MEQINEIEMLDYLKKSKKVLLIEPLYKRKYIPLGLSKISSFVKKHGGKIIFERQYTGINVDLICITSLFTYDSDKVKDVIRQIRFFSNKVPIIIGGVYASLMIKSFEKENVYLFKGYSKVLDQCVPDYSIDWEVESPWDKFSFVFTSRGCPNKCAYCAVWRIESEQWINPTWKEHIIEEKPYVMISDNNISSCSIEHLQDVVEYLSEKKKRVMFDNGLDCKHITENMAMMLSKLKFTRHGMRLAFDRIEEDGVFQEAVKKLKSAGISKSQIMVYVLFNFNDTPQEANYRMAECVKLGIRPYPQQYQPLMKIDRKDLFIGKYWTKNLLHIFRYFWLMAGHYTKTTFEEFVKKNEELPDNKYKLNKEDWEKWYGRETEVAYTNKERQSWGIKCSNKEEQSKIQIESRSSYSGRNRSRPFRWLPEPNVGVLVDGLPDGMDRFEGRLSRKSYRKNDQVKAIGNSIVPQIAELLFTRIKDILY